MAKNKNKIKNLTIPSAGNNEQQMVVSRFANENAKWIRHIGKKHLPVSCQIKTYTCHVTQKSYLLFQKKCKQISQQKPEHKCL